MCMLKLGFQVSFKAIINNKFDNWIDSPYHLFTWTTCYVAENEESVASYGKKSWKSHDLRWAILTPSPVFFLPDFSSPQSTSSGRLVYKVYVCA